MNEQEHYYSCRMYLWCDEWSDDEKITAMGAHCIPDRFQMLPQKPLDLLELIPVADSIMYSRKVDGQYDQVLLFSITGNVEGLMWDSEVIKSPTTTKGEIERLIKETHRRIGVN